LEVDSKRERKVLDVNTLAIFLVEDHPGHAFVSSILEEGLIGGYTPIILDILPLRAFWVMTVKWGCSKRESADAITHFLDAYDRPEYVGLSKSSILKSFRLGRELKHDVFDCAYLALAQQEGANSIITTDTDFMRLCRRLNLEYVNPVPTDVLNRFSKWSKSV
jgi:predicted nucleic acid-binding protein